MTIVSPGEPPGPLPKRLVEPHPSRLDPTSPGYKETVAAHRAAVLSGAPGYEDPSTGLFVFAASYLWERGSCCQQDCRHCPYVPRTEE
jgi:hypothetical protein